VLDTFCLEQSITHRHPGTNEYVIISTNGGQYLYILHLMASTGDTRQRGCTFNVRSLRRPETI